MHPEFCENKLRSTIYYTVYIVYRRLRVRTLSPGTGLQSPRRMVEDGGEWGDGGYQLIVLLLSANICTAASQQRYCAKTRARSRIHFSSFQSSK
jgi:hypothetical protein